MHTGRLNKSSSDGDGNKMKLTEQFLFSRNFNAEYESAADKNRLMRSLFLAKIFFKSSVGLFQEDVVRTINYFSIADDKRTIEQDPEKYPHEYAWQILFDDIAGLDHLLERTDKRETLEWGTFFKTHINGTDCHITNIVDTKQAELEGLVYDQQEASIRLNKVRARAKGYSCAMHYHPRDSQAHNFVINSQDRWVAELNSIGLISFNMPYGPEIIGFNKMHTYIPKSKYDRTTLVRADDDKILEYLV